MENNPFDDLIPDAAAAPPAGNPFDDLLPSPPLPQAMQNAQADFPATSEEVQKQGFVDTFAREAAKPTPLATPEQSGAGLSFETAAPKTPWTDEQLERMRNAKDDEEFSGIAYDLPVTQHITRTWGIENQDKAHDILKLTEVLNARGIPYSPSFVADNYNELIRQVGGDPKLSAPQLLFALPDMPSRVAGGIAEGLLPGSGKYAAAATALGTFGLVGGVRAAGGVALFHAQGEALDILKAHSENRPHVFLQTAGLQDFAPATASDQTKAALELLDLFAKGYGAHAIGRGAQLLWKDVAYTTVSNVVPGQSMFIPAEQIRMFSGAGVEGRSGDYYDILQKLGLSNEELKNAAKYGMDVEIPLRNIVTAMDAPWFAKVKEFLKVSPYQEVVSDTGVGKPTGGLHVSGLIEGRTEEAQALRDQVITPDGKTQTEVDNATVAGLRAELDARKAAAAPKGLFSIRESVN